MGPPIPMLFGGSAGRYCGTSTLGASMNTGIAGAIAAGVMPAICIRFHPLLPVRADRRPLCSRWHRGSSAVAGLGFAVPTVHALPALAVAREDVHWIFGLMLAMLVVIGALGVLTLILWRQRSTLRKQVGATQPIVAGVAVRMSVAPGDPALVASLNAIESGVIILDSQGWVTRANPVAERLFGAGTATLQGRPVGGVLALEPASASDAREPMQLLQSQGWWAEGGAKVVLSRVDGAPATVNVKAQWLYDEQQGVIGALLLLQDMTRLEEAEERAARLAAIVDSSDDAIVSKTLDGRIISWNGAAETLFGYRADEMLGQPVQRLIPDERTQEELRIIASLVHGERVPAFDTRRLTKDGRQIDVSVAISPIRNERGQIIGASKIARDISDRRLAERTLEKNEARLRFILEAAQIGDWDFDLRSGATNRSLRHDQCYGYDRPVIEWDFDVFLRHVHPEDRETAAGVFKAAVAARQDCQFEYRVIWPDGSVHWLLAAGSVLWQEGRATHMLGIVTDITRRKEAEASRVAMQRLEAENRQILVASQLKSQFLANMSHELRTPLNAIIGFADLLRSGAVASNSPKQPVFLGHIGTSGRHLLQLINDVLDLAKVESGKFEFFPETIDLAALIGESRDVLHTLIVKKNISLDVQIDPDIGPVHLDPARLKQVLYNYLSNAIKFTPAGGSIAVRATAEQDVFLRLEVQDSGIGISPADQQRLFVEFQQLDTGYDKSQQGTGLGLSLTRRLVQAQGGIVGVRSALGQGSTFFLVLNRQHGTHIVEPADSEVHIDSPAASYRCLAIEDPREASAPYLKALADIGYQVDVVSDREQALSLSKGPPYDAMSVDLVMRAQPGLDLLDIIRREALYPCAPVVGLTMPIDATRTASFAVANVLSKPIRLSEVREMAQAIRNGKHGRPLVMVIDDQAMALDLMRGVLSGLDVDSVCFQSGPVAIAQLVKARPDAIVLDLIMPDCDGFEVLDRLQRAQAWRSIPVYVWTSMTLTDADYGSLARSAERVLGHGGGHLAPMIESLRRRVSMNSPTSTMPRV